MEMKLPILKKLVKVICHKHLQREKTTQDYAYPSETEKYIAIIQPNDLKKTKTFYLDYKLPNYKTTVLRLQLKIPLFHRKKEYLVNIKNLNKWKSIYNKQNNWRRKLLSQ